MTDAFGPYISRADVQNAVLTLLQTPPIGAYPLIVHYLAEAERHASEQARTFDTPLTYRGGIDLEVYQADLLPAIIVVAAPVGRPERYDVGEYAQWFNVQLAAIVKAESEHDARELADAYGLAMGLLVAQHGGLGESTVNPGTPFAEKTNLEAFPNVEFAVSATASRNVQRAVVTFQTLVQPVLTETGPPAFNLDPYGAPDDLPLVSDVEVTLTAVETLSSD